MAPCLRGGPGFDRGSVQRVAPEFPAAWADARREQGRGAVPALSPRNVSFGQVEPQVESPLVLAAALWPPRRIGLALTRFQAARK